MQAILYPKKCGLSTKKRHIFQLSYHILSGAAKKGVMEMAELCSPGMEFAALLYDEDSGDPSQR